MYLHIKPNWTQPLKPKYCHGVELNADEADEEPEGFVKGFWELKTDLRLFATHSISILCMLLGWSFYL
jgi:hypothetical protein